MVSRRMAIRSDRSIAESSRIEKMCREAVRRYHGMAPEARRKIRAAQRRSWVVGEMMLEHPEMTRAQAEEIYEKVILGIGL